MRECEFCWLKTNKDTGEALTRILRAKGHEVQSVQCAADGAYLRAWRGRRMVAVVPPAPLEVNSAVPPWAVAIVHVVQSLAERLITALLIMGLMLQSVAPAVPCVCESLGGIEADRAKTGTSQGRENPLDMKTTPPAVLTAGG